MSDYRRIFENPGDALQHSSLFFALFNKVQIRNTPKLWGSKRTSWEKGGEIEECALSMLCNLSSNEVHLKTIEQSLAPGIKMEPQTSPSLRTRRLKPRHVFEGP